jgi:hypothetical protein
MFDRWFEFDLKGLDVLTANSIKNISRVCFRQGYIHGSADTSKNAQKILTNLNNTYTLRAIEGVIYRHHEGIRLWVPWII